MFGPVANSPAVFDVAARNEIRGEVSKSLWPSYTATWIALVLIGATSAASLGLGIAAFLKADNGLCGAPLPGVHYYHNYDGSGSPTIASDKIETRTDDGNTVEHYWIFYDVKEDEAVNAPSIPGAAASWHGTILHSKRGRTFDETFSISLDNDQSQARFHAIYTENVPQGPYTFSSSTIVKYEKLTGTGAFECVKSMTMDFTTTLAHKPRKFTFE